MGADAAAAVVFRKARRFIGSDLIEALAEFVLGLV
jgi:hypothetical protein